MCVFILPAEADPPLIVDSNAMLAFTIAGKGFKPVAGWNTELLEYGCFINDTEFIKGPALYFNGQSRDLDSVKNAFRAPVCKTSYHDLIIPYFCDLSTIITEMWDYNGGPELISG